MIDQTFADFIIDYVQSVVGRKEEDDVKDGWVDLLNTSMNHAAIAAGYPIAQETELTRIDDRILRSMVSER